jgi:hypothetical protein
LLVRRASGKKSPRKEEKVGELGKAALQCHETTFLLLTKERGAWPKPFAS